MCGCGGCRSWRGSGVAYMMGGDETVIFHTSKHDW